MGSERKMKLAGLAALAALPLAAHHATRAEFDDSRLVAMSGVVTGVQWLNPHAALSVDITDSGRKTVNWTVELPSPNGLTRQGWMKSDLKPGDRITLGVWVSRSGGARATMRTLTMPDGRAMSGQTVWDNPVKFPGSQQ